MKIKLKNIILLIFILQLSSCNQSPKDKDLLKINKALNLILKENKSLDKSNFIVNPYFNKFKFNRYSKDILQMAISNSHAENFNEVKRTFQWTSQEFKEIQNRVDNNYAGKFSNYLSDLSTVDESEKVYSFSGLSDNLVFVEQIKLKDKLKKTDFSKEWNPSDFKHLLSLVVLFKDNEPIKILVDGAIINE
ncbi:hypothetical protein LRR18_13855 [Mangrovimonas sp. AS39]|uniref:hypothetical protein n=1 Tax=Mangrovimonas futianensis TaxID=2895523 RepID=UPI001E64AD93|nr:hypothetical protein [Mangrovimonas futianensis]MCF1192676.1 hypothetical protein [Mangrovimonas futianensis]MCF1196403.1 hypothetical protein [Mangrovimonas futianensis]